MALWKVFLVLFRSWDGWASLVVEIPLREHVTLPVRRGIYVK